MASTAWAASPPISLKTISASQLVSPVAISNAGDGSNRLFVCDQVGQIRIIQDEMLLPTPFLDLSAKLVPLTSTYDEAGLLSVAFHPGFSNPASPGYRKFYVFYSAVSPNTVGNSFVTSIATGNPCTFTTTAPHGLTTGQSVAISGVTGGTFSPSINVTYPNSYTVTVTGPNTFTVPVNCTSNSNVSVTNAEVFATQPVYCHSTVSEFQVSANANVADPTTERVVLAYDKPQDNHNGSHLAFGPDGYLYISVGDGGSQHDNDYGHTGGFANAPVQSGNMGNAQDTTKLLGKILRIDPLGINGPTGSYGIPSDNPFATTGGAVRPEIYSFGMRNPWRYCWDNDPSLGLRMIEADVGQNDVEEINLIINGGNYGWRIREGTFFHDSTAPSGGGTLIDPVAEYFHPAPSSSTFQNAFPKLGCSIIGGYVYRGSAIPSLVGQYIFGDYSAVGIGTSTGLLMAISSSTWAMPQSAVIGTMPLYLTTFGVDESGELYVAGKVAEGPVNNSSNNQPSGVIYKIVPAQVGQMNFASITPIQENSIFAESPTNSDALGYLYAGENASGNVRRGLLAFNVANAVPPGATITSAQLMLHLNSTSAVSSSRMQLFQLTESWGQGTSGSLSSDTTGNGFAATEGDATWSDRSYDPSTPTLWTTAGGTHLTTASASNTSVGIFGGYFTWNSTAQMLSDIQGWLNNPSTNNGWLFEGSESTKSSVRKFDSMESAPSVQPTLNITYLTSGQLTWRETWLQTYYSPVGTYVNDLADPSSDGLNNLLDYAYGFSPLVAHTGWSSTITNPSTAGMQSSVSFSGANDVYTTTFLRDPRASDLTYQLQSSPDLVHWTTIVQSTGGAVPTGSAYVSEATQPGASPVQIVTATETLPSATEHFVRLQVTRPPAQ